MNKLIKAGLTIIIFLIMGSALADDISCNDTYMRPLMLVFNNFLPFDVKINTNAFSDFNIGNISKLPTVVKAATIDDNFVVTPGRAFSPNPLLFKYWGDYDQYACFVGHWPTDYPQLLLSFTGPDNGSIGVVSLVGHNFVTGGGGASNGAVWCDNLNTYFDNSYHGITLGFHSYPNNLSLSDLTGFSQDPIPYQPNSVAKWLQPNCYDKFYFPLDGNDAARFLTVFDINIGDPNTVSLVNLPKMGITVNNELPYDLTARYYPRASSTSILTAGSYVPASADTIAKNTQNKLFYFAPLPANNGSISPGSPPYTGITYSMKDIISGNTFNCGVSYKIDSKGNCSVEPVTYSAKVSPLTCAVTLVHNTNPCAMKIDIKPNPLINFVVNVKNNLLTNISPSTQTPTNSTPPVVAANQAKVYSFDTVPDFTTGSVIYIPNDLDYLQEACFFNFASTYPGNVGVGQSPCAVQAAASQNPGGNAIDCSATAEYVADNNHYACNVDLTMGPQMVIKPTTTYTININNLTNETPAKQPNTGVRLVKAVTEYIPSGGSYQKNPPATIEVGAQGTLIYQFPVQVPPLTLMQKLKKLIGDQRTQCAAGDLGPCVVYNLESDANAACVLSYTFNNNQCSANVATINGGSGANNIVCNLVAAKSKNFTECAANLVVNMQPTQPLAPVIPLANALSVSVMNNTYDDIVAIDQGDQHTSPVSNGELPPSDEDGQQISFSYSSQSINTNISKGKFEKNISYALANIKTIYELYALVCQFTVGYDEHTGCYANAAESLVTYTNKGFSQAIQCNAAVASVMPTNGTCSAKIGITLGIPK